MISINTYIEELIKIALATSAKKKLNARVNELKDLIIPMLHAPESIKNLKTQVLEPEVPLQQSSRSFVQDMHPELTRQNAVSAPKRYGDRIQMRMAFLTYSNAENDPSLEDIKKELLSLETNNRNKTFKLGHNIEEIFIVKEIHKSGVPHFHVLLKFFEKLNITNFNLFDIPILKHPNISGVYNKKNVLKYMCKKLDDNGWKSNALEHNIDVKYELKCKEFNRGKVAYEIISGAKSVYKSIREHPALLFNATQLNSNYEWFLSQKKAEEEPEKILKNINMFGLNLEFDGRHKSPQFWICGNSGVGKTLNIHNLEQQGYRSYLCSKDNNWADYDDKTHDFMYFEEYQGELMIRDMNQLLEGTKMRLNAKYTKSIVKNCNKPIFINSNYMPHEAYNKADRNKINLLLKRLYVIYVDKSGKGHIVWKPDNNINKYDSSLICMDDDMMEDYINRNNAPEQKEQIIEYNYYNTEDSPESYMKIEKLCSICGNETVNKNTICIKCKFNRKFRNI